LIPPCIDQTAGCSAAQSCLQSIPNVAEQNNCRGSVSILLRIRGVAVFPLRGRFVSTRRAFPTAFPVPVSSSSVMTPYSKTRRLNSRIPLITTLTRPVSASPGFHRDPAAGSDREWSSVYSAFRSPSLLAEGVNPPAAVHLHQALRLLIARIPVLPAFRRGICLA
jgi:hypothetical protein